MEAGHPLGQLQAVAREADVDLVAADRQEGGLDDLAPQAHLALGLEVGDDVRDDFCPLRISTFGAAP